MPLATQTGEAFQIFRRSIIWNSWADRLGYRDQNKQFDC